MQQLSLIPDDGKRATGPTNIIRGATFSDDGTCRMELTRTWAAGIPLGIVMCNPSDGNHEKDDPTLKRVILWAWLWGFPGIIVLNATPAVSSKPADALRWHKEATEDHSSPKRSQHWANADLLIGLHKRVSKIVVACGAMTPDTLIVRTCELLLTDIEGTDLWCLGLTRHGFPKHPMARGKHRIPDTVQLQKFDWEALTEGWND